jgi:hypothetical protein
MLLAIKVRCSHLKPFIVSSAQHWDPELHTIVLGVTGEWTQGLALARQEFY